MHDLYEYIGVIQLKNKDYKIAKKYLEESNDLVPDCYITKLFLYLTYI